MYSYNKITDLRSQFREAHAQYIESWEDLLCLSSKRSLLSGLLGLKKGFSLQKELENVLLRGMFLKEIRDLICLDSIVVLERKEEGLSQKTQDQ